MKKNPTTKNPREAQQKSDIERRYLEIIVHIYVVFVLAFYPLYVTNEGYDNIVLRKAQMYWTVTIIFFIAFSIFYVIYYFSENRPKFQKRFLKSIVFTDWALLGFLFMLTISFLVSPYKSTAWLGTTNRYDGYFTMLLMVLCYFPISRYYKPKQLDFIFYAVGSSILCIIGFLQFYGYDFLNLFPYNRPPYADESGNPLFSGFTIQFRSTIGNVDFLSCYVCIAIVAFGVLFIKSEGWRQYLYLAAAAMNFVLMLIGGAAAGKVGTLGAMILLVPYWIYSKKNLSKTLIFFSALGFVYCLHHWFMVNIVILGWTEENRILGDIWYKLTYSALPLIPILIVSLICFAIGICMIRVRGIPWLKPKAAQIAGIALLAIFIVGGFAGIEVIGKNLPPHNIIYQAREIIHGNLDDSFGSGRGFIWKRAIERVWYQPVFGTGSDTFFHAFGRLNQNDAKEIQGIIYDKAHNDFIQILLCNGVLGLLAYLAFIVGLIISSIKKSFNNIFSLAALGGACAYLIQSFFGIDTLIVTPIYWTMLAVLRVDTYSEIR